MTALALALIQPNLFRARLTRRARVCTSLCTSLQFTVLFILSSFVLNSRFSNFKAG